ncbi:MAG TPA: beta-ketoacyl-ACP synthase III [Magnetospirillaceae bacterium]|nr:beta-ketoacyl-ACP synthase III [Magnetospirillaceae bacterium]
MAVLIRSTGAFVPEHRCSNDEITKIVDTTDDWIRSHTGIEARRVAPDGMLTSDLALGAARDALRKAGVGPDKIDFIVVATATPDYFGFPSTACIVQDGLGAAEAAAFDVVAGCTGFIYAADTASAMLEVRRGRYALAIGAEILTRVADWSDRASCVLFGDGAGCVLLERVEGESDRGILASILGSDGSGARDLYLAQAARDRTFHRGEPYPEFPKIVMNGRNVYNFAVKAITKLIEDLLVKSGIPLGEFRWIIPHQANLRIVQAAAKRFGLPEERFYMNIQEYANTSAASVPIALNEIVERSLLSAGDLIMLLGFGAGLTFGGSVIRY